jgi:hypothetical protein
MKGIFVKHSDEFKVSVFVTVIKDEIVASSSYSEFEEQGIGEEKVERYEVIFRRPSYKDQIKATSRLLRADASGDITVDQNEVNMSLMVNLIKSWDFKDEDGKNVPVLRDNIESLNPSVALAISEGMKSALGW